MNIQSNMFNNNANAKNLNLMKSFKFLGVVLILMLVGIGCESLTSSETEEGGWVVPDGPQLTLNNTPSDTVVLDAGEAVEFEYSVENGPFSTVEIEDVSADTSWLNVEADFDNNKVVVSGTAPDRRGEYNFIVRAWRDIATNTTDLGKDDFSVMVE